MAWQARQGPSISPPNGLNRISIGRWGDATPGEYFDGEISLVQIYSSDVGAAWLKADYEQIADPAGFGVAGTPEDPSSVNPGLIRILHYYHQHQ